MAAELEKSNASISILKYIDKSGNLNSLDYSKEAGMPHYLIVGCLKSLESLMFVELTQHLLQSWNPTEEGKEIARTSSPELLLLKALEEAPTTKFFFFFWGKWEEGGRSPRPPLSPPPPEASWRNSWGPMWCATGSPTPWSQGGSSSTRAPNSSASKEASLSPKFQTRPKPCCSVWFFFLVVSPTPSPHHLALPSYCSLQMNGETLVSQHVELLKRRKLILNSSQVFYRVLKGPKFSLSLPTFATDLTTESIASNEWEVCCDLFIYLY